MCAPVRDACGVSIARYAGDDLSFSFHIRHLLTHPPQNTMSLGTVSRADGTPVPFVSFGDAADPRARARNGGQIPTSNVTRKDTFCLN